MARKFQELVDAMPVDARERAEAESKRLIAEYAECFGLPNEPATAAPEARAVRTVNHVREFLFSVFSFD